MFDKIVQSKKWFWIENEDIGINLDNANLVILKATDIVIYFSTFERVINFPNVETAVAAYEKISKYLEE